MIRTLEFYTGDNAYGWANDSFFRYLDPLGCSHICASGASPAEQVESQNGPPPHSPRDGAPCGSVHTSTARGRYQLQCTETFQQATSMKSSERRKVSLRGAPVRCSLVLASNYGIPPGAGLKVGITQPL